jgi:Phage integrase family.
LLNLIDAHNFSNVEIEVRIKLLAHLFPTHSKLVSMNWDDINFDNHTWDYMQTKTGETILVPLSNQVIGLLNSLKKVGSAHPSPYVFSSNTTKTGHISSFKNEFLKIINPNEHTIHGFIASARTMLQHLSQVQS